jgi:hypothetical protein
VRHLAKRVQELNDKLFDFAKKTMHAPQWGEELQEILDVRDTTRKQLSAVADRGPLPESNWLTRSLLCPLLLSFSQVAGTTFSLATRLLVALVACPVV